MPVPNDAIKRNFPAATYQTISITDWSPGIIEPGPTVSPQLVASGAQSTGTYACYALPNGSLSPLPGVQSTLISALTGLPAAGTEIMISGFLAHRPQAADELFFIMNWISGGSTTFEMVEYISAPIAVLLQTFPTSNGYYFFTNLAFSSFTTVSTTAPNTGFSNTTPSQPGIVGSWGIAYSTPVEATSLLFIYPNPAAPTVAPPNNQFNIGYYTGYTIPHNFRILVFSSENVGWPTVGASGLYTNEHLYVTDPPGSDTMFVSPWQALNYNVFGTEHPQGYGAFMSNGGALYLVKKIRGAVIVSGDALAPTSVVYLPNVQGTSGTSGVAAATPLGGVTYVSGTNGAYVWTGGQTSQKISQNIPNNAFLVPPYETFANIQWTVESWGQFILFSNNWLYDIDKQAWWHLDDGDTSLAKDFFWYRQSPSGDLYALSYHALPATNEVYVYQYSFNTPATEFQYTSQYFAPVPSHKVRMREVALSAFGTGSVTITLTNELGATASTTFNVSGNITQTRSTSMSLQGTVFTYAILSSGGNGAPIIEALTFAYSEDNLVGEN